MKKIIIRSVLGITVLIVGLGVTLFALAPREVFSFNAANQADRLPANSLEFITTQYPDATVLDVDLELTGFEAYLSNGVSVDFRFSGAADYVDISSVRSTYVINPASNSSEDATASSTYEEDGTEDSDIPVSEADLPETVVTFITTNYSNAAIAYAEQDEDGYDVYLASGQELEFDLNGRFISESQRDQYDSDDDDDDDDDDDNDSEVPVDIATLPETILTYVSNNYPDETIVHAERDNDGHEVYLSNGVEIDFDFDGTIEEERDEDDDWDDWNDWDDAIAASELPESILNYLSSEYPGDTIIKAERDEGMYEVTLGTGLELTFDQSGQLIDIDWD